MIFSHLIFRMSKLLIHNSPDIFKAGIGTIQRGNLLIRVESEVTQLMKDSFPSPITGGPNESLERLTEKPGAYPASSNVQCHESRAGP